MASKADWPKVNISIDKDGRKFFTQHEWETMEALVARIYPADHQPGAREAGVTTFIDHYLSGIDYIYATADGSGFMEISGKHADSWRSRVSNMQRTYRAGLRQLDALAKENFDKDFKDLGERVQDGILEVLSGEPKPESVSLQQTSPMSSALQGVSDQGMPFFDAVCLHTRQGMFCDPVYGGNRDRIGWDVIGFPGPKSLKDTRDCTYSVKEYFVQEYDWEELIPHLKQVKQNGG
ncbi:MAG TPA: gluconate 2-dehydrogenase subunit 3 family protein [Alphaproteobacteria bacterium]|nr:gluconate 2-dehydrogenase subunit 3 family protein [Alphaproteobacteria bacterium]